MIVRNVKWYIIVPLVTILFLLTLQTTIFAQRASTPTARIISPTELRIDFAEFGQEFALRSTNGGSNYTNLIRVDRGSFGASAECGVLVSVFTLAAIGSSAPGTIAVQGTERDAADIPGGGNGFPACSANITSRFPTRVNVSGGSNVNNPPAEQDNSKIVNATVRIDAGGALANSDAAEDSIDLEGAPANDTIRLVNAEGRQFTKEATREVSTNGVVYKTSWARIETGEYRLCSDVVAKKCQNFTKEYGQIANIVIRDDGEEYDILRGDQDEGEQPKTCEDNLNTVLAWIACPVLGAFNDIVNTIFSWVDGLLSVDGQEIRDSDELYEIWSYFRLIATFLLLAVGMFMVISQAIGGNG